MDYGRSCPVVITSLLFAMLTILLSALVFHKLANGVVGNVTPPSTFGSLAGITLTPATIASGNKSTGVVSLTAAAASPGVYVNLASSNTALATAPQTVFISPGATLTTFNVTAASGLTVGGTSVISASYNGATVSQTQTILPMGPASVTLSPTAVVGGASSTGTVTLNTKALAGGFTVNLSSNTQGVTVPATTTIISGATTATFAVATVPTPTPIVATIRVTANGLAFTAPLTVNPPNLSNMSVSPNPAIGGTSPTGTVQLNGLAPAGGIVVGLSSESKNAVVGTNVKVAAGSSYANFPISTLAVPTPTALNLTAKQGGISQSTVLTLNPPALSSFILNPSSASGGTQVTGTVTLTGIAPAGGANIKLSSNNPAVLVPPSVIVPEGASSLNVPITPSGVAATTTVTLAASLGNVSKSAPLTINPTVLSTIVLNPATIVGGNATTGTINLTGSAPAGGMVVTLKSSVPNATLPSTVTVPAGSSIATFTIQTGIVTGPTTATITATQGANNATATLSIQPDSLSGISLSDSTVVGGSQTTITGTLTFSGPTPASGTVVQLSSSSPTVATVPASVKAILTGSARTVTFPVTHLHVTKTSSTTIQAKVGNDIQTVVLTSNPFAVTNLTIDPASVTGGTGAKGTVTLNASPGLKSGPVVVKLSSSTLAVKPPVSVTVAEGVTTGTFALTTTGVTTDTSAAVTATLGTGTRQAILVVHPPVLTDLSLKPTSVKGSATTIVTGTITLSGPAPTAGITVTMSSSNASLASAPATVKVLAGKSTVTFTVTHKKVSKQTPVSIDASFGGITKSVSLTLTP